MLAFPSMFRSLAAIAALAVPLYASTAFAQIAEVVSETETGRIVAHAGGETEIPLHPERIVTVHNIFAEALVAFGAAPIGSVERPHGLPGQLAAALADTQSIGQHSAPDFEAVLALAPDLILAQASQHAENYELLSAIAPTVLLDEPDQEWREWYLGLGEALGLGAEATAAIDGYDARAAEVRDLVASVRPDDTVLLLRVRERDIRVYGGARRSGPVLYTDLALNPHPLVPLDDDHTTVSNEIIPELTADHIFLMVEDEDKMAGIEATALWQSLPAVEAGHVHRVNIEPWNQSQGPISFSVIVEDIATHLGQAE